MSAISWVAGYLVGVWLLGYGIGQIFVYTRKFVEKAK